MLGLLAHYLICLQTQGILKTIFLPLFFNSQNNFAVRIATKNREEDANMTALWTELTKTDSDTGLIQLMGLEIFS